MTNRLATVETAFHVATWSPQGQVLVRSPPSQNVVLVAAGWSSGFFVPVALFCTASRSLESGGLALVSLLTPRLPCSGRSEIPSPDPKRWPHSRAHGQKWQAVLHVHVPQGVPLTCTDTKHASCFFFSIRSCLQNGVNPAAASDRVGD